MITIVRALLQKIINDIDSGNSNLTNEECLKIISLANKFSRKDEGLSRTQAAKYLRCSLSKFDKSVKAGVIPKGQKILGFTELRWYKKDLDEYVKQNTI